MCGESVKSQQQRHQNIINVIIVSLTSFWCLYWTDVKICSGVSILEFEQVNADWEKRKQLFQIRLKKLKKHQNDAIGVVLVFLLLTLNIFHIFF